MIDSPNSLRIVRITTLVLMIGLEGCGNPGEGSVQVSSESRSRILPHTSPNAKDKKGNPIGNKSLSVKEKMRQNAGATGSAE